VTITICNFSIHCYDYFRVKRMILLLVKLNDNFDSKCISDLLKSAGEIDVYIDRKWNSDHPSRVDIPIMLRSNVIELKHSKFTVSRSRHDVPKKTAMKFSHIYCFKQIDLLKIQSNLSTTTTLGTQKLWPLFRRTLILKVWKLGHCWQVVAIRRWTIVQVWQ
jgi:hypothetical protein